VGLARTGAQAPGTGAGADVADSLACARVLVGDVLISVAAISVAASAEPPSGAVGDFNWLPCSGLGGLSSTVFSSFAVSLFSVADLVQPSSFSPFHVPAFPRRCLRCFRTCVT
jgi:hypothetical protein